MSLEVSWVPHFLDELGEFFEHQRVTLLLPFVQQSQVSEWLDPTEQLKDRIREVGLLEVVETDAPGGKLTSVQGPGHPLFSIEFLDQRFIVHWTQVVLDIV